jgi:hypothetical protein
MSLELNTITFNHNPSSASNSAMNIRRNKDFEVPIPEYDRAIQRKPRDSCAAYALAETARKNVFIRVNFQISTPANPTYEVKATGGGIMGQLGPIKVKFTEGSTSQTVDIPLTHRNFKKIGRHDITWQWLCRELGSHSWKSLSTTSHRIYLVLAVPESPWTQAFGNKRNPWTDLLDECCLMAAESKDAITATKKITEKIYGDYHLRYDIVSGSPRYGFWITGTSFHLTNWINYVLKGNAPSDPKFCFGSPEEYKWYWIVNCYDCAASLALMSKVVGAPVDYCYHGPFGYLKYVEPIGRGKCNNPFYGCLGNNPEVGPDDERSSFGNHAYAKMNDQKNYDATMKEWLPIFTRVLLMIVWALILIITLGTVNLRDLLERADGWLMNLTQSDYEQRTIDTSQPFESSAAGGSPALQTLQFQVT